MKTRQVRTDDVHVAKVRELGDTPVWNQEVCTSLIAQLWGLRVAMLARESHMRAELDAVLPAHRDSARNLIHYLSLWPAQPRVL